MPLAMGQALMTSVEMCGTLIAATLKMEKDGWYLPPFSDGQTMELSVSLSPSKFGLLNKFAILGTILGYVFYWIAVIVTLFVLKRRGTPPVVI